MNIRELRVGNLIEYRDFPKNGIIPVTGSIINALEDENYAKKELYAPIPLTEDWLYSLGFDIVEELKDSTIEYCKGDFFILFLDGRYVLSNYFNHKIPLQYLHQVQNLYYALTGQELLLEKVA